ncbi:MAG: vanadium-dependent haloperoxidase [Flavobacteriales bacterium]|nr:vanadium-dependent haloperoxidase [Flavobacteriales bacterium]
MDAFSPPVASRVYVYPHLAHYLTLRLFAPDSLPPLEGALNGWTAPATMDTSDAHPELTALLAFCRIGRKMVFSEQEMDRLGVEFLDKAQRSGMAQRTIDASIRCAEATAAHMGIWIDGDNYSRVRTMDRHTSTKLPGHWVETPPDHTPALEPNWRHMRPILLDAASTESLIPPPPYLPGRNSDFHRMVLEVHANSKVIHDTIKAIALYWDDNPNASDHRGHLVTMEHKISPPGHWLNIISGYTRSIELDVHRTTEAYTLAAIAMYDGLIGCWTVKFDTDLVRPITYIQEYIEPEWMSLIQTPPFPEFPSGHAVVSSSAATVLETLFGAETSFTDSTEFIFGMGIRHYPGFQAAADEVAMSRFHAGIHYLHGVQEGKRFGREEGTKVMEMILGGTSNNANQRE